MKLNLHRFLSLTGEFETKEQVLNAIHSKQIKVDGKIIHNQKYQFNPNSRTVLFNNKKLEMIKDNIYIIMNKPIDYLSTRLTPKDIEFNKKSMFELLNFDEKIRNTIFAVGRLDEKSSGLIILTTDGKLSHKLTNPDFDIPKTYEASLEYELSQNDVKKITDGVEIDLEVNGKHTKYITKPTKVNVVGEKVVEITLTEGKKREVRRIFESIDNDVINLKRISIGNIKLKDFKIKEGEYITVDKKIIREKLG